MAEERHLALRTIRKHIAGIFNELDIRNLKQLLNTYEGGSHALLRDVPPLIASKSAAPTPAPVAQNLYERFSPLRRQRDGSLYLEYVPVKGRHFIEAAADPDGTLQINVKVDPALRDSLGSGKDMVLGLLERLRREGIAVSRVHQVWLPNTTNHSQYLQAIGDLKNSADEVLRNKAIAQTWSGQLWGELKFDSVSNFDFNELPDGSISFILQKQGPGVLRSIDEI